MIWIDQCERNKWMPSIFWLFQLQIYFTNARLQFAVHQNTISVRRVRRERNNSIDSLTSTRPTSCSDRLLHPEKNYYCIAGWEWKDPNGVVLNNPPKKWSLALVVNLTKKTSTEPWLPDVKTRHRSLYHIVYNNNAHKYFHVFWRFKSTQNFRLMKSVSPPPKNFILPACWYYSWCGI